MDWAVTDRHYAGPLVFEHDGTPTFDDCLGLIREVAYHKWLAANRPAGDGVTFWLEAERVLFGWPENGAYRIYVRDLTKPKTNDFYDYHEMKLVSRDGLTNPSE
jgi:hypothetical protein